VMVWSVAYREVLIR